MIARALDRLLHDEAYRARFMADPGALGLDADDLDALSTIDHAQLLSAAEAVRRDVIARNHRGSGSLADLYRRTIAGHDLDELARAFIGSDPFMAYREIPHAGVGLSLEEAFHRWCTAQDIGTPAVRDAELCAAMVKALLFSPRPSFHVPDVIHACPRGVFAIAGVTLFAALDDTFVTGDLTPFLVDLLLSPDAADAIAARHGVSDDVRIAAEEQLRSRGLLA